MKSAKAFCPGHVTGFFSIYDSDPDPLKKGSRGCGICLSKGARSEVVLEEGSEQKIDIVINDKPRSPSTMIDVVKDLIGDEPYHVTIECRRELPIRQGFGMSGAGLLSTALAITRALKLPKESAVQAAHVVEVNHGTGLGDIAAQAEGGVVLRHREGAPPHNKTEQLKWGNEGVVLCVLGKGIKTKDVIRDPIYKRKINTAGNRALAKLEATPSLKKMMTLSHAFSKETGLMSHDLERTVIEANKVGMASMSMIGNSLFALGDVDTILNKVGRLGEIFVCDIEKRGVHPVFD